MYINKYSKNSAILSIWLAAFIFLTLTSTSGCGDASGQVEDQDGASSHPTTVSARVKQRLAFAAANGVSDRELIVIFHPEILPLTLSDVDASGNVLSPDEYADRMGDEMDYYIGLYKVFHPAPSTSPGYQVLAPVGGDSIEVLINGKQEFVRLIGLDVPKNCGAPEAIDWLTKHVDGKTVTLEPEPALGDRDETGRLLRYIWINDTDIGMQMIGEGKSYVNEPAAGSPSYKYLTLYRRVQKIVKDSGDGVWDPNGCGGKR